MIRMYGNWRSAAAFRVRIALKLKGLAYEETFIDLDAGDQHAPEFRKINPQGAVPALFDGDGPPLTQSLAILDYLEETKGGVPLLPADPRERLGTTRGETDPRRRQRGRGKQRCRRCEGRAPLARERRRDRRNWPEDGRPEEGA